MVNLRDYQIDILNKIYEHWEKDPKLNILVQSPTGSGKSITLARLIYDLKNQDKYVLLQVHRKELVAQLSITLCKFNIEHNLICSQSTARQTIAMQRAEFGKNFYNPYSSVTVASVDTILSREDKLQKVLSKITHCITDEAAHVLKENKWGRAIKLLGDVTCIGFTATPERLDKKGLGSWNDGVFDVMIEGPKVKWLIGQGNLSKYKIVAPPSDFEQHLGEVKSNTSDFSSEQIVTATKKSHIIGDVVENYLKFAQGTQAIVFAPTLDSGKEMEGKFLERGITAKFLSSFSTDSERYKGVQDFTDNKINVLLNVDLFDEGFDVPSREGRRIVETVIMARPTMSLSKVLQIFGRGLRPSKNKPFAIIIDHVGNVKRHGLPDKDRKWSLERPERRKSKSTVRICVECLAAYDRTESQCPYCGAEPIKAVGSGGRVPPEMVDGDLVLIDPDTIREMEAATILEEPARIAERVGHVAGIVAAKSAAKKQQERIDTQSELKEVIALWAGYEKAKGLTDRQIHKKFFIENNMTIAQALAMPRLQMRNMIEDMDGTERDRDRSGHTEGSGKTQDDVNA